LQIRPYQKEANVTRYSQINFDEEMTGGPEKNVGIGFDRE